MAKLNWGRVLLGGLLTATPAVVVGQESAGEAQEAHRRHIEWGQRSRISTGAIWGPLRAL